MSRNCVKVKRIEAGTIVASSVEVGKTEARELLVTGPAYTDDLAVLAEARVRGTLTVQHLDLLDASEPLADYEPRHYLARGQGTYLETKQAQALLPGELGLGLLESSVVGSLALQQFSLASRAFIRGSDSEGWQPWQELKTLHACSDGVEEQLGR